MSCVLCVLALVNGDESTSAKNEWILRIHFLFDNNCRIHLWFQAIYYTINYNTSHVTSFHSMEIHYETCDCIASDEMEHR